MSEIIFKPHQAAFADARETFVGLFGGVGNGKTFAASTLIVEHSTMNPKNLCLVGRLTYPELRDSTKEVFMSYLTMRYPPQAYVYNKAENSIKFWNESVVIFRHLDNQQSLLGPNLGAFYIDQAEEVDEDAFLTLQSRLRRQKVRFRQGIVTGNPRGHNWVYYKFGMDQAPYEAKTPDLNRHSVWKHGTNYRMITAPTHSNLENLPTNYIAQLQESYSPEWYQRYVLGSWDAFDGQVFDLTRISGYDKLPEIKFVVTACDPAISKEKNACNTAFCTVGVGRDGHIYDLETIAGKWSFLETLEQAQKVLSRQKSLYLGVESVAYQQALVEACRRYFPYIQVVDLKADRDKFRRAKSVSHIIAKGLFHTNNKDLLSEISAFVPDATGGEKIDRVDALVHALHMVQVYAPTSFDETPKEKFKGKTSQEVFIMQVEEQERRRLVGDTRVVEFSKEQRPFSSEYY